ncbi:hypothetical protein FAGAP_8587 [Fusarium agapanthi]|uniref:Uncharacterized protein n=1 Tax=Fusarium agapanthi TaxID=1803897 RepID=A0A9P5B5S7_9HYPO|nr:hypothetical protein FAGAP_8587 [Fusarium agapanthi]
MQTTTISPYWHLLRAQWTIDQLEMALHASNLTTANPRKGLKVNNELESWTVEYDGLINEDQCKEYEWVGLRLKSPLFRPETFIPGTDSKAVMDIMNKMFLTVPNAETRLVVKVFIPKHLVNLDLMKAIVSMLWLADPLLSDIHPAHCGPNSLYSLGLQYTNLARDDAIDLQAEMLSAVQVEDPWNNRLSPDRKLLELLPHPGDLGDPKYRHRFHRISNVTSVQDLIYLMDIAIYGEEGRYPNASPAYCFPENKTTLAIENSQHCGTLDMLETSLWAHFCVKITQHCLNKSGTFFYESYPNLRYCSTIHDFLKEQGLGELSKCFQPQSNHLKVPDLRYWHPIVSAAPPEEPSAIPILSSKHPFASHFQDHSLLTDRREELQKYIGNESYYFGIELELYMPVLLPHEGRPDPHPNDGRELSRAKRFPNRVALMKEIISSKGPLTLVWDEYFDQNSWESKLLSHGMVPVDDIDHQYQTWTIGTDVSLRQMSAWGGYKQLNGLEIISPVLRNTPECWEEVLDMVSILRNNFRLTVGKSCGFHVHWSEMNVPADFKQYIPVDKVVDRRTLGILKKLWTAKTLQRVKLLKTPSMGLKSCLGTVEFRYLEGTLDPELILRWSQLMVSLLQFADLASPEAWQNFAPAVLQCPVLGKGDDYDFWVNRIKMMMNLPLDAQQLAHRPIDNNEILPPLDEGYIDALREELCTREMKLPCTIQKAATLNGSESSNEPGDLAKLLSEKASVF